ncbi:hypothetical protein OG203_44435 [Nocardia sp. NBC_01499]|uniref:hypothetical protein n=1 Tax=Nocardia sp. NBC_01499 TaxID=2903597 RepID=UPI00386D4069
MDTWDQERYAAACTAVTRVCADDRLGQVLRSARFETGDLLAAFNRHRRSVLISVALESARWRVARWRAERERRLVRIEEAGHKPWALVWWLSERLGQLLLVAGVGGGLIVTPLAALQLNQIIAGPEPSRLPDNQECYTLSTGMAGATELAYLLMLAVICALVIASSTVLLRQSDNSIDSLTRRQQRATRADDLCITARNDWSRALTRRVLEPFALALLESAMPSPAALRCAAVLGLVKQVAMSALRAAVDFLRLAGRASRAVAYTAALLILGGVAGSSALCVIIFAFGSVFSVFGAATGMCLNSEPGLHLLAALGAMLVTGLPAKWLVERLFP